MGSWMPPDLSTHGGGIDRLITTLHWFMAILFVGWGVFYLYCLVRFWGGSGRKARYELIKAKPSKYLEVGVVIFEAILLVGFSMPVWAKYKNEPPTDAQNPLAVRVVAQQFAWNIHYPGPDGVFGKTRPDKIDSSSNPIGLDEEDPAAADDVVSINVFHMPANRPVVARLTTMDVIHSFWIPVLRVKQDVIPGMEIPIWFQAQEGASGEYDIQCAQLCGLGHYRMRGAVTIHSEEEFNALYETGFGGEEEFLDDDDDDDEEEEDEDN